MVPCVKFLGLAADLQLVRQHVTCAAPLIDAKDHEITEALKALRSESTLLEHFN